MSINRNPINQTGLLKQLGIDAAGVCLEACRRWVRAVLQGEFETGVTVYDIMEPKEMRGLLEAHRKRNNKGEKSMEGLTLTVTARTGGGFKKFKGLRTRQNVIDHVLSVPGAYIYVVDKPKGGGHAFAFNTIVRNNVLFFDPNLGEWSFDRENDTDMRSWWHNFWEGNMVEFSNLQSYKDAYHNGGRELWMYTTPDNI